MPADRVDVDASINSGQVFLWTESGGLWYGVNGSYVIRVSPEPFRVLHTGPGCDLFRMSDDYPRILDEISKDGAMRGATKRFAGLRLLRQEPFQCLISFIASSNSNIQNIRGTLRRLCAVFGGRCELDGREFALFPGARELAQASGDELLRCGLGYRAGYVREAARMVQDGRLDLEQLKRADYAAAKDALLQVPGVGEKVADCAMLFSLEKMDAFPLDRWMLRAISRHYPDLAPDGQLTPRRYAETRRRLVEYFGPHAGYAQQFLFKMQREDEHRMW